MALNENNKENGAVMVDRKEIIHQSIEDIANEVHDFIKDREKFYKDRWVPAIAIKEALELNFVAVPKGNKQYGKKGWLFAIIARILEENMLVEYKKIGCRAYYRSKNSID